MTDTGHQLFDLFYDRASEMVHGGSVTPAWSPDGKGLAYLDGPIDERRAWWVDLATGDRRELLDVEAVRAGIRDASGETPPGRGLPFAHVSFMSPGTLMAQVGSDTFTIDVDSCDVGKLPAPSMVDTFLGLSDQARKSPRQFQRTQPLMDPQPALENPSPDGRFLASTRDGNLVVRSTVDGRETALTQDGTSEHEWRLDVYNPLLEMLGMAVPVTNWSPDGALLAAYKVDNRGVAQLPQVHWLKREDEVVWRYHAKAGGVLERYTLHLVAVYGKPALEIDLGDTTDTYPVFAGWLPDASEVLVFVMSRDCRRVDILAADARTGSTRRLFSEQSETFIRIHHDVYFARKLGMWLTPDGRHIVWKSARTGWDQLYLYDLRGTLVRPLTEEQWPVHSVVRITPDEVYFTASSDPARPYDVHLHKVPLGGGPIQMLTSDPGVHSAVFAPDGQVFLDSWSSSAQPPVVALRASDGSLLAELSRGDSSALDKVGFVPPQQFQVTAADGETQLWGVMMFPVGFDASKKYPVIEYVYGGPQLAVAPHAWQGTFARLPQAIAQWGYVTVVLDGRGTPGRSKPFHDACYLDWAGPLVADHGEAMRQLVQRHSFLDGDRVGVTGHSWGGYSAFRLLADRPDVYKAAVSSAPGFDPYSSVLYECYLGLPQTNRAAYDAAQTLSLADSVEGDFMLVCGTADHSTWTDAVKMSEHLIRAGKQHEFVVMPEQPHGYDSVHDSYFWRKIQAFFGERLRPGSPAPAS